MTKKKPTSLEALMAGIGPEARETETLPVAPATMPPKTMEKLTVYVPRAAAKRLKQMALDHDKRVNDFLQEGVDLMLAKYGQQTLREYREP